MGLDQRYVSLSNTQSWLFGDRTDLYPSEEGCAGSLCNSSTGRKRCLHLQVQMDTSPWKDRETGGRSSGRRWRNVAQRRMAPQQSRLRNLLPGSSQSGLLEGSRGGMCLLFRAWKEAQLQTDEGACAPKRVSLRITFWLHVKQQPAAKGKHRIIISQGSASQI